MRRGRPILLLVGLVFAASLSWTAPSQAVSSHAAPGGTEAIPGVRQVRAVVGLVRGLVTRNRVYRDVDEYRKEANALHDAYVTKAQEQLAKGTAGGLRTGQLAQYRRIRALLDEDKRARESYLDEQAQAAKRMFAGRVKDVVKAAVSATPLGQRAIGLLADGFDFGRKRIDQALVGLTTGNVGEVIGKLERVRNLGQLGSSVAGKGVRDTFSKLDRVLGAPLDQIDKLRPQLEDLSASFAATSEQLRTYATETRRPRGSELGKLVALSTLGLDGSQPGAEAAAAALTRTRPNIRAEARARILAGAQARCTAKAIGYKELLANLEHSLGTDDAPAALGAVCQAIDLDTLPTQSAESTAPEESSVETTIAGAPPDNDDRVKVEGTLALPDEFDPDFITSIEAQHIELSFAPDGGPVTGRASLMFHGIGDVDGNCPFSLDLGGDIAGSLDGTGAMTGSFDATLVLDIDGPASECFEDSTSPLTGTVSASWDPAAQTVKGTLSFADQEDPADTTVVPFEAAVTA